MSYPSLWKYAGVIPRDRAYLDCLSQKRPDTEHETHKKNMFGYVNDIYMSFMCRIEHGGKMLDYMFPKYIDPSYVAMIETEVTHLFPECTVALRENFIVTEDDDFPGLSTQPQTVRLIRISLD